MSHSWATFNGFKPGTRAMSDLQTPYYLIDLARLRVNMG